MKKIIGFLISAALSALAVFGMAGCVGASNPDPNAYSFITIDINPSVELLALGGEVIEVKPANYDACVLLQDEDFSYLSVEDATARIVALAEEMGYLTDTNNQVKITVISDDAQTVEVLKNAAKTGAEKGSKKAVTSTEPRLQDELTLKKLKEEKPDKFKDVDEEKIRLISSLMEYDEEMTYEQGADMTVNELASALKEAVNASGDIFTAELRAEYSARYAAAKYETEREIAAVLGEEYLAAWEQYVAVDGIYSRIVAEREKAGLSEEDVAAVTQLLGIADSSLIQKGGVVKPEYVLNYIDKHINKKAGQDVREAVNEVVKILDGYDADNYELTVDEIDELGLEGVATLSDVAAVRSELKANLEEIKDGITLTDAQTARIRELKDSFSTIKQSVLEDMSELIEEVRAQISAEKQERRG